VILKKRHFKIVIPNRLITFLTVECHPEPVECHPEPVECHPEPVEG